MKKEFQVELCINTVGEVPEAQIMKCVFAENEAEALSQAKEKVKLENPELNNLQIDTWHIEQLIFE